MLKVLFKTLLTLFVVGSLGLYSGELLAQNSRDIEVRKAPVQLKEQTQKKKLSKRQAKKQLDKTYAAYFNRLVGEYEDRMVANVKKRNELAKEYSKPQYSDPSYFGHKKKPKKRRNGKKRKCKECLMWH